MAAPTADDIFKPDIILNNLPSGVIIINPEGIIQFVNACAGAILQQDPKVLQNIPLQTFFGGITNHDDSTYFTQRATNKLSEQLNLILQSGDRPLVNIQYRNLGNGSNFICCIVDDLSGGTSSHEMLRIISEGTASVVGGDFFRSLAYHIIVATGIRYALITECANLEKTRVRTMVYIDRDKFLENFEYNLTGTPCEIVMRGENYYCSADLDHFFPKEEGVKSYFGVPIFLSTGEVIGHIAIFDNVQMEISPKHLSVLKIFASRAGAEIERKRKDLEINSNLLLYKKLFEESPVGLCEEDFSDVKNHIDWLKSYYNRDLKTIFDEHPDEIFKCWKKIRRVRVNRAQQQVFDVNSVEEYALYMQEAYMPMPARGLLQTFDNGVFNFERETEIVSKTGRKKTLKVKRLILPGAELDWSKSLISCVDITEMKNVQAELQQALEGVRELKEKFEAENIYLQHEIKEQHNFEEIISGSEAFKKVLEKIELVADTDATVLITGESGTGKELIARAIHAISKRNSRPLVKVNCAALPTNLIESELFGHEKGAFTGAIQQKIGRFELADGGTIFLDEVGELPIELQAKLLRILQEGEFERVGGSKTLQIDVRVIAATNRDLEGQVNNREFRADLFYRLNVFPIYSPPLRERKEDIQVLVNHFCKKHGAKMGRQIRSVSKNVMDALHRYDWPGNVRELENVIERGIIISKTDVLETGEWLPKVALSQDYVEEVVSVKSKNLSDLEKQHILDVLNAHNWKIRGEDGAAKALGLNPTTLEARMKKLGITRNK